MATTITATCVTCGEVYLDPDDVGLQVCTYAPASFYTFECPICGEEVQRPASQQTIAKLISVGVPAMVWEHSTEFDEPHYGPLFTVDDLLDFHLLLEQDDWFERLLETRLN